MDVIAWIVGGFNAIAFVAFVVLMVGYRRAIRESDRVWEEQSRFWEDHQ